MADVTRLNEIKEVTSPFLVTEERRDKNKAKMWGVQRNIAVDVLMAGWGLGTWLGVNGIYVQLPLLVQRLPEGWTLPSFMVIAIQLANVGIPVYGVLRRLIPGSSEPAYIYAFLGVGTLALAINAFLYNATAVIGGTERSVAFLVLTFFAALVGCTSSVLFYPYLRHFREAYLATYFVGEGLSGLVPSLLALVQGVGGEPECRPGANSTLVAHYPPPRFDSTAFLLMLASLSAASIVSFAALHLCRAFDSERVTPAAADKRDEATTPRDSLLAPRWQAVLALTVWLNALNSGVLPSVQSYSCMPYGTRAYHLAVTLSAMTNPAACLAGVWLRPAGPRALAAALAAGGLPLAYILTTALLSPTPPLHTRPLGEALVVVSWVCVSGVVTYARMWAYGWARRGGARGMRACGAATQLGAAAGSLLLVLLVNYTRLFTGAPACPVGAT